MGSHLLLRIVSSSPSSFALFICLFGLTLAYRIQLTIGLFTNRVKPFDFGLPPMDTFEGRLLAKRGMTAVSQRATRNPFSFLFSICIP